MDYIDPQTNEKYYRTVLKTNDLVVSVRGEVGKVGIVFQNLSGFNINANVIKISLHSDYNGVSVSPQFIWAYLNSRVGKMQLKKRVSGGVQETITVDGLSDIDIILPPYEIQMSLYSRLINVHYSCFSMEDASNAIFDSSSKLITSALAISAPQYTEKLVGAVRLSSIVNDSTFSADYYHPERLAAIQMIKSGTCLSAKKLSDIVSFHRDIVDSSLSKEPYLGLAGVQSQTGELSGVAEEAAGQAFVYNAGDILYGRLRPYLNKVLLAESSGICSTEFHVMRIKESAGVRPGYLAAILRSDLILSQTKHMMTGNTHPRISNDDVKNLYIPIPSLIIQQEIEEELQKRRMEARTLKLQAEKEWAEAKAQFERALLGE